ncbi:MAG: NfeD family protein [Nitrosomonadales bacterium]|nr:NfeD family protein [Nitrosomonadales bacterium]
MEIYIYWFLLAIILVGLEMVTGTFYLLVVAIAMAVGGVVALLGAGMVWQLLLGAITGIAGTIILRRWKSTQTSQAPDDNFDIGQAVKVLRWNDNGTARVNYRGAEWDAELESADTPREGTLYIAAVRGSALVLTHRKQQ